MSDGTNELAVAGRNIIPLVGLNSALTLHPESRFNSRLKEFTEQHRDPDSRDLVIAIISNIGPIQPPLEGQAIPLGQDSFQEFEGVESELVGPDGESVIVAYRNYKGNTASLFASYTAGEIIISAEMFLNNSTVKVIGEEDHASMFDHSKKKQALAK